MDQANQEKPTQDAKAGPGYEVSDAKISLPVIGGIVLVVITVGAALLMAGLFYVLAGYHDARDEGPSPMAASRMPPQGPRLLPDTPDQVEAQAVAAMNKFRDRVPNVVMDNILKDLRDSGLHLFFCGDSLQ